MKIHQNVSLQSRTWFQTGGPAKWFCEPANRSDFEVALRFAGEHDLPLFILGEGANILVADDGFPGLVVHPVNTEINIVSEDKTGNSVIVRAGAGTLVEDLIEFCLEHNITGLEQFGGIPGTIGGAVFINLHYFDSLLSDFFHLGRIIHCDSMEFAEVGATWFRFGYDTSRLHEKKHILYDGDFQLTKSTSEQTAYARGQRDATVRHRARRYPRSHTCGSFFRNFFPDEVKLKINDKPMTYVAYYFDKLGIKGQLRVGDAMVSTQHANMLVNHGNASSADIVNLARNMQELVYEEWGVIPQPECQFVGFDEYPLLLDNS